MMSRQEILDRNPLQEYLRERGFQLKQAGGAEMAMLCPFHEDTEPSFYVNTKKQAWICRGACGIGGSVIDLEMRFENLTAAEAMKRLAGVRDAIPQSQPIVVHQAADYRVTDTYNYTDAYGRNVFFVERLECPGRKKKFRQYQLSGHKRVNNMDGVQRVLWRLPEVLAADEIWLVEGEKCAKACLELGYQATCNPGGSNAWMAGYAEYLRDKNVVVCPDNDEAGKKWLDMVLESLEGTVGTLRIVRLVDPDNDIADFVERLGAEEGRKQVEQIYAASTAVERGVSDPIFSLREMMREYRAYVKNPERSDVQLYLWLPSLKRYVRALMPGDVVTVIADTGVGKTALLQCLAKSQPHVPVLYFQIELSPILMFERLAASASGRTQEEIENIARMDGALETKACEHIYVCPLSKVTVQDMERLIGKAELKIGKKPGLVVVDYIGLVRGGMGKRYERLSTVAEDHKILAKTTNTVVVLGSQVKRDETTLEVRLHSAKDTGSIENSSSLVVGAWRPDQETIRLKILKNTRGSAGHVIDCAFDGARMQITEKAEVERQRSFDETAKKFRKPYKDSEDF